MWLDERVLYLAESRDLIRCAHSYRSARRALNAPRRHLSRVGRFFPGTNLAPQEVANMVKNRARIFASPGEQFGPGGETLAAL